VSSGIRQPIAGTGSGVAVPPIVVVPPPAGGSVSASEVKTLLGLAANDTAASTIYVDGIARRSSLRWAAGFSGPVCWQLDETGRPVDYHASPSATESDRAATVPGTNGTVWIVTQPPGNPVSAYTAARDA